MIIRYRCGHEGTEGFWKDDAWMQVRYLCPDCKLKNAIKPAFRTDVVGRHTLIIRLARVVVSTSEK